MGGAQPRPGNRREQPHRRGKPRQERRDTPAGLLAALGAGHGSGRMTQLSATALDATAGVDTAVATFTGSAPAARDCDLSKRPFTWSTPPSPSPPWPS